MNLFILDYNFWTRNARKSITKAQKENFSEILWPSGWALGQVIWAKMAYFTYDVTHKKSAIPNQKNFFQVEELWLW